MCRAVAECLGGRVSVSDIEARLGGPSRTLTTVRALYAERPTDRIVLTIGSDLLAERERWYGYPELAELVEFFIIGRSGHPSAVDGGPRVDVPDVSSTEIRSRAARGATIAGLVAQPIAAYVEQHRLYQPAGAAEGGGALA